MYLLIVEAPITVKVQFSFLSNLLKDSIIYILFRKLAFLEVPFLKKNSSKCVIWIRLCKSDF